MIEAFSARAQPLLRRLARARHIRPLEELATRVRGLPLGDRAIAYALAGLVALAALFALFALEQSLLVSIPGYGGRLSEGEVGSPRFINPLLAITDADRDLSALTYAGLMGVAGDGSLVPVLAQSYELSPDGTSYTFRLRANATFSDGTPLSAADVVFTVERAQDLGLKSPSYADWTGVRVEALDARTVRFTLARPYAPFLSLMTLGILPAHLWQTVSNEEFPFSTLETNPVGAGPFAVTAVSRGASGLIESVTLAANRHYALGRPYLDSIRLVFFARADDLARALASGAVESAYGVAAPGARTASYSRIFGVFLNPSEKRVFARAEVREALSRAIDRARIIDEALSGYAAAVRGPVPPGGPVVQAPLTQDTDPTAAAAALLEKNGWTYDGGIRLWKNARAKQTLDGITIRTSNVPELKSVASAVKAAWERLGIPTDIELYEPGDLSQNVIRPRKYEALLYGMVIGRDQDLYAFWDSQERNDPGLNIALYANKTVDALLEDARSNADPRARAADLQKIENTVADDYPAVFLYAPDFVYALPADLAGVELPQITAPADRFASVARWYRATESVWPFFAPKQ